MGPRPKGVETRAPLIRGSLVHAGLAQHYRRMQARQEGEVESDWATPEAAIDSCALELGPAAAEHAAEMKSAIDKYRWNWSTEKLEVLAVEEVFSMQVGTYKFTQRMDLVAQEQDGKVWIYDHKTTGRLSKQVGERYTLSGQFIGMQTFGREMFGEKFGGVKMNLIGLSDPVQFSRQLPDPAPAALGGFKLAVLHARERIAALDASGLPGGDWPQALSEQVCVTAYGKCDYFDKCRFG